MGVPCLTVFNLSMHHFSPVLNSGDKMTQLSGCNRKSIK